jgi:ferredoxin
MTSDLPDGSNPAPPPAEPQIEACETVTVTLHGQKRELPYRPVESLFEMARRAGLQPPYSCLAGVCGSCMAKVTTGAAIMDENHVLSPDEVAEGYVLTCQAYPITRQIAFIYEE